MTTAVVFHDLPIADAVRDRTTDLSVVDAETEAEAVDALADAEIFVTNPTNWSDSFLDSLDEGDWMQATSIGYAAFPVDEFRDCGVALTNASTLHDSAVSEHAFALTLALSRNLAATFASQRDHDWDRSVSSELWDWEGRQLTVFGLGNIGEAVARRADAFGLEVYGVKRTPSTYTGTLSSDRVFPTDDFRDLLPETDLLVLTVPLTDATHQVIDEDVLAALPDSAVLINVARGSVVDQDALVGALEDGELGGAGLDVFEEEPLPSDSPLWERDDVVVTPHIGGRSRELPDRFARLFADNLDRWRDEGSLVNRVD